MKTWLMVLAATTVITSCEPVFAGPTVALQGDTLITRNGNHEMLVPHVPKGLSADVAYDLVTGKIPETLVAGPVGETTWSFGFPWIMSRTEHLDKIATYSAKTGWAPLKAGPMRSETTEHRFETLVMFWIPALLILAMSLLPRKGADVKRILFFYAAVFGSAVGGTVGPMAGFFVGIAACGIAGLTVARNTELGFFAGAAAGAFVGASTGYIETTLHSHSLAAQYWFFLLVVECVSFALVRPSSKKEPASQD